MRRGLLRSRRGQVFALDALFSLLIIFLLMSLIRTSRSRLAAERDEWAQRFQLEKNANDLIEALVREPGQHTNGNMWICHDPTNCPVKTLARPGLAYVDSERGIVRPAVLNSIKVNAFFLQNVSHSQDMIREFAPFVGIKLAPNRDSDGQSIEIGDTNRTTNPRLEKVSITRVVIVLNPDSGYRHTEFLTITLAQ